MKMKKMMLASRDRFTSIVKEQITPARVCWPMVRCGPGLPG
jgi:hypothetical protein